MKKKNLDKWFLMSWRKAGIIVVGWFLAVLLHNLFYAIFGFEDAIFFTIAFPLIPIYFLIAIVYSLIRWIRKNK